MALALESYPLHHDFFLAQTAQCLMGEWNGARWLTMGVLHFFGGCSNNPSSFVLDRLTAWVRKGKVMSHPWIVTWAPITIGISVPEDFGCGHQHFLFYTTDYLFLFFSGHALPHLNWPLCFLTSAFPFLYNWLPVLSVCPSMNGIHHRRCILCLPGTWNPSGFRTAFPGFPHPVDCYGHERAKRPQGITAKLCRPKKNVRNKNPSVFFPMCCHCHFFPMCCHCHFLPMCCHFHFFPILLPSPPLPFSFNVLPLPFSSHFFTVALAWQLQPATPFLPQSGKQTCLIYK